MNANIYTAKRNELTALLDQIIRIPQLEEQKLKAFEEIKRKSFEDQFNITLVGEFQGGKSTSFNAFCDGREISPRGALVKTSACRLTARNLADKSKNEYAVISWKSKKELLLSMDDILANHIDMAEDLKRTFKPGDQVLGLSDVLDLDKEQHREMIITALTKEWQFYEENRSAYTPESLDMLRIATLIIRFYGHPDLKVFLDNMTYEIGNIARLMIFPADWEQRWSSGVGAKFLLSESMFAFIGSIDCFIHSKNLERLGCSITDCPGLFASKWDTRVAIETIPQSDAIIYLLRGDRAIGTEEIKALREIQKMPSALKKLFFALNIKAPRPVIESQIIPTDIGKLSSIGLTVEDHQIKRYHALLAFLGQLGLSVLDKSVEEQTITIFNEMAKRMNGYEQPFEQAWTLMANQQLLATVSPPKTVQNLNRLDAEKVMELSGFKELFDGVEEYIIKNKAYSILVTNGAEKVDFALTEISKVLKNREDEATEDVEKRRGELLTAKKNLEVFQTDAIAIVDESFPVLTYDSIVNDFFSEVILDATEEISVKIAHRLGQKLTAKIGGELLWKSIFDSDSRDRRIAEISRPIYQEVMQEVIRNRAKVWLTAIAKGENPKYEMTVIAESKRVIKMLENRWVALQGLEVNIPEMEYPNIAKLVEYMVLDSSLVNDGPNGEAFFRLAKWEWIGNIFQYIFNSPRMLWNWLVDVIGSTILERVDGPAQPSIVTNPAVYDDLDYKGKQLYKNILSSLRNANATHETTKAIKADILERMQDIGEFFKRTCGTALDAQKENFLKDYKESEENLSKSSAERLAVAEKAREMRERFIDPCKANVERFLNTVLKFFTA